MKVRIPLACAALVLAAACSAGAEAEGEPEAVEPPVEEAMEPSAEGSVEPSGAEGAEVPLPVDRTASEAWDEISGWGLRDSVEVDLDGDGQAERVLLAAAVDTDDRGRAMWDDGQRWAVAVIDADSIPTLVFERFVQLGRVSVALLDPGEDADLLITESGGAGQMVWEIAWRGPNDARVLGRLGGALRSPNGQIDLPE